MMRTRARALPFLVAAIILGLIACRAVEARPLYAARTGMSCARCHVDPAGGGMRSATGFRFALNGHTMAPSDEPEATINPLIADGLRLGADLRGQYMHDAHNELRDRSTFFLMQATIHVAAELNDRVTVVAANDQGRTTEAFALIRGLPLEGNLKAGRFRLAYGIEEEDHTTFTRDSLGFGNYAEDTGLELTFARGAHTLDLALVNGDPGFMFDDNGQKALVGRFRWLTDRVGTGVSGFVNTPRRADRVYRYGAFAHLRHGPIVIMGEYDRGGTEYPSEPTRRIEAAFVEASYLIDGRATMRIKFDRYDPDLNYAETAQDRLELALEYDLAPFTRLIALGRGKRQYGFSDSGARKYGTDRDTFELIAQLACNL